MSTSGLFALRSHFAIHFGPFLVSIYFDLSDFSIILFFLNVVKLGLISLKNLRLSLNDRGGNRRLALSQPI